jgi:hypothetical protein
MILILFLLLSINVYAQETGAGVVVSAQPEVPTVGVIWRLTLLVDHEEPDEVVVIAPSFTGNFRLDRQFKNARTSGEKVKTAIDYVLVPSRAGIVRIEPFTIWTPSGNYTTGSMVLNVRGSGALRPVYPKVAWEGAQQQMTAGEQAVLSLRVTGASMPPPEFFMPEVPTGVILTSVPMQAAERGGGIAIMLSIIPIEGDFILPARVLRDENIVYDIPALRIPVLKKELTEEEISQGQEDTSEELKIKNIAFPKLNFGMLDIVAGMVWRGQCEFIYYDVMELWDKGLYARAIAELRQNERDHPAGAYLRPLRRQAEETLGIFNTIDENRWKRKLILSLMFAVLMFITVAPCVYFILIKKAVWKKIIFFACIVSVSIAGYICLYLFMDTRKQIGSSKSRFGVTTETSVRRMADYDGNELFKLKDGQPVVIMLNSGSWLYVRTNDTANGSGWVPKDSVIFY